jgi:hypothetical protein
LLLNQSGSIYAGNPNGFMMEYTDPEYVALELPRFILASHKILFGDGSDYAFARFRVNQYLKLIHSTELGLIATGLDPRVTYLDRHNHVASRDYFISTPTNVQASGVTLYNLGPMPNPNETLRIFHNWIVKAIDASTLETVLANETYGVSTSLTFSNGISSFAPLAGFKDFGVYVGAGALTPGATWKVETFTLPSDDLNQVVNNIQFHMTENAVDALFDGEEPFPTLKRMWLENALIQYKLGSFVAAVGLKIEEVRAHGGK